MENNQEKWMGLCELASKESDSNKLIALTNEIIQLLGRKILPTGQRYTRTTGELNCGAVR